MNKRILIVEDEEALCITLGDRLRREGYEVDFAFDGSTGLEKITSSSFDLIILDIMLPSKSGLDLCMEARRVGIATPILFLTARNQTVDRIIGLKLGGDDYLAKPFDSMELLAHVEALVRFRRTANSKDSSAYVQFDSMTLDLRKGQVHQNGNIINLTTKEFQLLRYFTEHPGETISREELLSRVWDLKPGTMTRTVDMHIGFPQCAKPLVRKVDDNNNNNKRNAPCGLFHRDGFRQVTWLVYIAPAVHCHVVGKQL
jgi:DNA-binding response OmpR family regulator